MTVNIVPNRGYWEVHINGKFYCSADTFSEAVMEYKKYMNEGYLIHINGNQGDWGRYWLPPQYLRCVSWS